MEIYEKRRDLARSLDSATSVLATLDRIVLTAFHVVLLFIAMAIFDMNIMEMWFTVSSVLPEPWRIWVAMTASGVSTSRRRFPTGAWRPAADPAHLVTWATGAKLVSNAIVAAPAAGSWRYTREL